MKHNQSGIAHILIIFAIILAASIGFVGYRVSQSKPAKSGNNVSNGQIRLSSIVNGNPPCTNSGRVTLTKPLINPDDLKAIWPLGKTVNGHVTPIDHQYYIPTDAAKKNGAVLYAPADGIIFGIESDDAGKEDPTLAPADRIKYGFALAFSCNQALTVGIISGIAPDLQKYISSQNTVPNPIAIPVKAGQELGTMKGNIDVGLIDTTSKLTGFVDVGDYIDENWKPYAHSLADYYGPALRDQYNAKSVRKVQPLGGKIDYDQPGKLIGNWFKQGSLPHYLQQANYWQNELAIFYDFIDPAQIRIMIGDFASDQAGSFGFDVVGNVPDPATISLNSGLVKYSLVNYTYVDQSGHDVGNFDDLTPDKTWHVQNQKSVWGVALVQMTEARKIKFEVYPGKTAAQVTSFDNSAAIYER